MSRGCVATSLRSRAVITILSGALLLACVACSVGASSASPRIEEPGQSARSEQHKTKPVSNSRDAFPSAENTGTSGDLVPYDGPLVIRTPGTLIENVEITASNIGVAADNVTFRNVRFVYSGSPNEKYAMVTITPRARGTVLEDCEIDGRDGTARAISGTAGVTVRGCDIHNAGNGVEVEEDFTLEHSYIHDIFTPKGMDWHSDGVQAKDVGVRDIRITNNTILLSGDETAAVHVISKEGMSKNIQISGNLLGGGGYTAYVGAAQSEDFVMNNNAFTTEIFPRVGWFGAWYPSEGNVEARGNFILGSGDPTGPPW